MSRARRSIPTGSRVPMVTTPATGPGWAPRSVGMASPRVVPSRGRPWPCWSRRVDGCEHPRIGRRQETEDRHHEIRRVELGGAEVLGERPGPFVPAIARDDAPDLLAAVFPVVDAIAGVRQIGQRDGPVQGHPAHDLGVEEVLRFSPHLPDPWSRSCHRSAAVSAQVTRKRRVSSSMSPSCAASRCAAPSSSPYTSICCCCQAPLPTRTGDSPASRPDAAGSARSGRAHRPHRT